MVVPVPCISCCRSSKRDCASCECLKCATIFLLFANASLTLHCDISPSCTTSCSVCAKQPRLGTAMSSIAAFILLALSRRMTCTFSRVISQLFNISVMEAAIVARLCTPVLFYLKNRTREAMCIRVNPVHCEAYQQHWADI